MYKVMNSIVLKNIYYGVDFLPEKHMHSTRVYLYLFVAVKQTRKRPGRSKHFSFNNPMSFASDLSVTKSNVEKNGDQICRGL